MENSENPLEYFSLLFDELIEYIMREMYRYASQVIRSQTLKEKSRARSWKETRSAERLTFWGLLMLQALVQKLKQK